jgi:hypothetical protein
MMIFSSEREERMVRIDRLYTANEAAERLRVSKSAIRAYWSKGLLLRIKVHGAARTSESAIQEFLARSAERPLPKSNAKLAYEGRMRQIEAVRHKKERAE